MAEEEHRHHSFGHHETADKKEQKNAMYWSLGIGAAGLVVAVLFFFSGSGGKKQQSSTPTVVQPSTPFIPNPTDVSIGSNAAPLFWPGLHTSGTPSQPKKHHHEEKDTDDSKSGSTNHHGSSSSKKKKSSHSHMSSNDHKGYGRSPTPHTHPTTVTHHTHNPVVEQKG